MTIGYDKLLCHQSDRNQWVIREMTMNWTTMEGSPFPFGATWIEQESGRGTSLCTSNMPKGVTLLIYAHSDLVQPVFTHRFDYLQNKSGRIWHCRIPQSVIRGASLLCVFRGRPQFT